MLWLPQWHPQHVPGVPGLDHSWHRHPVLLRHGCPAPRPGPQSRSWRWRRSQPASALTSGQAVPRLQDQVPTAPPGPPSPAQATASPPRGPTPSCRCRPSVLGSAQIKLSGKTGKKKKKKERSSSEGPLSLNPQCLLWSLLSLPSHQLPEVRTLWANSSSPLPQLTACTQGPPQPQVSDQRASGKSGRLRSRKRSPDVCQHLPRNYCLLHSSKSFCWTVSRNSQNA